jgi:hypothetical protein
MNSQAIAPIEQEMDDVSCMDDLWGDVEGLLGQIQNFNLSDFINSSLDDLKDMACEAATDMRDDFMSGIESYSSGIVSADGDENGEENTQNVYGIFEITTNADEDTNTGSSGSSSYGSGGGDVSIGGSSGTTSGSSGSSGSSADTSSGVSANASAYATQFRQSYFDMYNSIPEEAE